MMMATTTTIKACSKCGTDKTYLQNNCEKWYYIHNNDIKERICKNCYSKSRIKKPIIDLTNLKPSQIKIDNNSFATNTIADKPQIDTASIPTINNNDSSLISKKKHKRYANMSFEEREAIRKLYQKTVEKKKNEKLEYIPTEECLPYVTDLEFCPSGSHNTSCRLCDNSLYYECGVKLVIPNFEIKQKELSQQLPSSHNLVLCKVCLEQLYKFCSASKISSDQDRLLRVKIFEREKRNTNVNQVIPRDKTDHRNFLEISDEIEKEAKKELSITKDFMI